LDPRATRAESCAMRVDIGLNVALRRFVRNQNDFDQPGDVQINPIEKSKMINKPRVAISQLNVDVVAFDFLPQTFCTLHSAFFSSVSCRIKVRPLKL
jgi:hypothetical protein